MNVGALGLDRPVDAWHVDSVDYVAVIILSDTAEMEGGELQVVLKPKEEALAVMERQGGVMRKEQVSVLHQPALQAQYCHHTYNGRFTVHGSR